MLQNAYLLAKIGANTAENEGNFAGICQIWQLPYGSTTLRAVRKGMLKVRGGRAARQGGAAGGGRAANLARLLPKLAEFFVSSKNI